MIRVTVYHNTCQDCGSTFKTGYPEDNLCPLCIEVDKAIQEDDIIQLRDSIQQIANEEHSNNIFKRLVKWATNLRQRWKS